MIKYRRFVGRQQDWVLFGLVFSAYSCDLVLGSSISLTVFVCSRDWQLANPVWCHHSICVSVHSGVKTFLLVCPVYMLILILFTDFMVYLFNVNTINSSFKSILSCLFVFRLWYAHSEACRCVLLKMKNCFLEMFLWRRSVLCIWCFVCIIVFVIMLCLRSLNLLEDEWLHSCFYLWKFFCSNRGLVCQIVNTSYMFKDSHRIH